MVGSPYLKVVQLLATRHTVRVKNSLKIAQTHTAYSVITQWVLRALAIMGPINCTGAQRDQGISHKPFNGLTDWQWEPNKGI